MRDVEKSSVRTWAFREQLDRFVWFHLGFDAEVCIEDVAPEVQVSIRHARIETIAFRLDSDALRRMITDPEYFEEFMLTQLAAKRRPS
jgi:hypothetical protein